MAHVLLLAPACDGEDVGEAWVAFQWASRLAERHELTVLTYAKRGHTPISRQLSGVRVIEWDEPPLLGRAERLNSLLKPAYLPYYWKARAWVRREIRSGTRFDIAHQPVPVAMRYPSPVSGLGIPLVIGPVGGSLDSPRAFASEEGSTPWYQRLRALDGWRLRHDPLLRRTYEEAACVVGIAPYVRDHLAGVHVRRFVVMSETGIDHVPDPVDRSGRDGIVRLLHVGRLVRTKGAREAIRAMASLRDLPVELDVVGDGFDGPACQALVDELGLHQVVHLRGAVPREEVDEYYRRADIFVFPSYREPGGNVVFEAMGYGLPLVVADRGGPASAVDDSCAIRLPVHSPQQLAAACAAAVRTLVTDTPRRRAMGAAARDRVEATALWQHRLDTMSKLYDDVRG